MAINIQKIHGNWTEGWALDFHTISSRYDESRGGFNTLRTRLGETLYRLKYRHEWWLARRLARTAVEFIKEEDIVSNVDCMVTIPPTEFRLFFQPVRAIAKRIGKLTGLPVETRIIKTVKRVLPVKGIENPEDRTQLVRNMFSIKSDRLKGKIVLLFDDLYRSGMTLNEAARTLKAQGEVAAIYALTITKTRVRR